MRESIIPDDRLVNSSQAWLMLAVLLAANILSYVDRMLIGLLVEPIKADLGLSDTEIGALIGLGFALVFAIAGLPIGRRVDQGDRRRIIAIGCAVWSVASVAIGFARSFSHLLVARMGVGVGEAALAPAATSLLGDYFSRRKLSFAMSIYALGGVAGSGIALLTGGAVIAFVSTLPLVEIPVYGTLEPWQLTMIIAGLPSFLIIPLVLAVREPPRRGTSREDTFAGSEVLGFFNANKRFYIGHFAAFSILSMFAYALGSWNPAFLIRVHDVTPAETGFVLGLVWLLCAPAGALAGGYIADRRFARGRYDGASQLTLLACAAIGPLAGSFPLVDSFAASIALMGLLMFFVGMPTGLATAMLNLATPNRLRGQMVALYLFTVYLVGYGIGPTLVGALSDFVFGGGDGLRYALSSVGFIAGPLAFLAMLSALGSFRRMEADRRAEEASLRSFDASVEHEAACDHRA